MNIQVLYVPGCPNQHPAIKRIKKVLRAASLRAQIEEIPVNSEAEARALRFPGSPTIRIDGIDIESTRSSVIGLACRLYGSNDGVPSEELLRIALARAGKRGNGA